MHETIEALIKSIIYMENLSREQQIEMILRTVCIGYKSRYDEPKSSTLEMIERFLDGECILPKYESDSDSAGGDDGCGASESGDECGDR